MRRILLSIALVLSVPGLARACPLCFSSSGSGTLRGFYLSTALLLMMPFALIALVAFCAFADQRRDCAADNAAAPLRLDEQEATNDETPSGAFADAAD
jgi:cbb3-type cytochrome oxidase subunit 3